jgi:hypothetical protein
MSIQRLVAELKRELVIGWSMKSDRKTLLNSMIFSNTDLREKRLRILNALLWFYWRNILKM